MDEMDEDERMVEDLLCPSSPMASNTATPHISSGSTLPSVTPFNPTDFHKYGMVPSSCSGHGPHMELTPSSASVFTTTDPFYLAQLQATQQRPTGTSFFATAGRPSSQSPFVSAEQSNASNSHPFVHRVPVSAEAEPHHLFAW